MQAAFRNAGIRRRGELRPGQIGLQIFVRDQQAAAFVAVSRWCPLDIQKSFIAITSSRKLCHTFPLEGGGRLPERA